MEKSHTTIRLATNADRAPWNQIVRHPLQSWEWGEFRMRMGVRALRLVVTQKDKPVDCWQLTFHKLPGVPFSIGYFPKGPTITRAMLETLETLGKERRAIFIQIEPNVLSDSSFIIHHLSFIRPSHHPLFTKYTFVLDLTKSEEELLNAMHPKTRYNLKVAQKHGVMVQEDNSKEAFEIYLKLSTETSQRQGFYAHNETYHRRMWETLHPAGLARLFTATYQGEVLAAWIIFVWNKTIYYPYGASSREHREVMAPTLLLWEISRWGGKKGMKAFDLWGALEPNPDKHDPWYGFHRFKQGFNPQLVECIGSYDLILNPLLYRLYTVADRIRWQLLKT